MIDVLLHVTIKQVRDMIKFCQWKLEDMKIISELLIILNKNLENAGTQENANGEFKEQK